ncbi:LuxR C-terminal-related transcriptional regulator [Tabrizicola sp. YIM 78059]|uniref:LuxR C-terminal-related transcriptional regulator n=1 Tax=Tabrizicola sp. YIM 78059 TaxID=2529861 RepID=UPI0010A9B038|nr:LuxR C-terminal-related transcriptional regulator [Tabrizicola sp. YIM 78059]
MRIDDIAGVISPAIAAVERPEFHRTLEDGLRRLAPFDLSCTFAYADRRRPLLLHDGLGDVSRPEVMEAYLNGGFELDCVFTACKYGRPPGLYRLTDIAPDAFFEGPYFNSPDIHPCISMETGALAEEIVFLIDTPSDWTLAYSLMRRNGAERFSSDEFARLAAVDPLVRALVARHWAHATEAESAEEPVATTLQSSFETFAADRLTAREREVVKLVLEGHSTCAIALRLEIAEGTVKNHRKSIHAKLNISSQAELFSLFLRHVRAGQGDLRSR